MSNATAGLSTKDQIAASAKKLFEAEGFAAVTVRAIASDAGVDPSLIIRHFGSKDALFVEVLDLQGAVQPPIDGPIESLGVRLASSVLTSETGELSHRMANMIRASDRELIRESLQLAVRSVFIDQLVNVLPGRDAEVRAHLITAQLAGIAQSEHMIESAVLPLSSRQRLIELYGRAIQSLVDDLD